jgi:large subunit ribosomal protein L3
VNSSNQYKSGDSVNVSVFSEGDYVDITGTSKGKGFQGGMKRCGWSGGKASHGSMHHRRVGSIGASSYPSRVHKGKTMPGHMGDEQKTIQNLKVIKIDAEKNLIAVKGPIVGHNNGYVVIKEALKKPKKVEKNDDK